MLLGPLFLRRLYENKIVAKYYYLTFYSNQTLSSSVIAFGTKNGGNSPLSLINSMGLLFKLPLGRKILKPY